MLTRRAWGPTAVTVLTLIPLVIWALMQPLATRFASLSQTAQGIGQISGLAGMALFSVNLILSARLAWVERAFKGLNRVYIDHHRIGSIAFILLLTHPLSLTLQYLAISIPIAADFLLDISNVPILLGKLALGVMMAVLVITFYTFWKYENWRMSHEWMGFAFFVAGLHVFFIPSDVSRNFLLRYYMLGLAGAGLLAYAYHTLFNMYKRRERAFTVESVERLNESVTGIEFLPTGQAKQFIPGQFGFVRFAQADIPPESHPFSLITRRNGKGFALGIKAVGDFTSALQQNLRPGTSAFMGGPHGEFSYLLASHKNQVWMAGGIGITPFISMARDLAMNERIDYSIDLFYSVRVLSEAVYLNELKDIAVNHTNFRVYPFISTEQGFITAEYVKQNIGLPKDKDVFLCGPPLFMSALRKQFVDMSIPSNLIHSEEFSL